MIPHKESGETFQVSPDCDGEKCRNYRIGLLAFTVTLEVDTARRQAAPFVVLGFRHGLV